MKIGVIKIHIYKKVWEEVKMNNKIVYVTKEQAQVIKMNAAQDRDVFFAEIDGAKIRTEEDYVRAMSVAFAFPHALPKMVLGWYNDYIHDLMWIEQEKIVTLIHDYDLMLAYDLKIKETIISHFEEITLPWWEGEVVGHMVGGMPRSFMVYLESGH